MLNELTKWKLQMFADGEGGDDGAGDDPNAAKGGKGSNGDEPAGGKSGEGEKKYTDAEVDAILDKKFAKWQKEQEAKIEEAKKLEKMSADEKNQHELEKLKKENADLRNAQTLSDMRATASKLLKEKDIDATTDILDFVATTDADETKANIDKFVGIVDKLVKAAEVKRNTGKTPKDFGGNDGKSDPFAAKIEKYK
jgi:hypothetical protein|nr:MAG TPA: Major head protein [Caudoviricetes sp.]DAV87144.1 MAG TPA: Major head protein [Caudoviricetes sp.]